jgi:transcriptional regulator with XRE-family HTH domain
MGVKELIKTILERKQWSANRLARESGVSKQMLSLWTRKGASSVVIRHLVAIKKASGMSWSAIGKMLERIDSETDKGSR